MSMKIVIVFSVLLVAAQAVDLRLGFGMPPLGINRIAGGAPATKGEFPHQVTLQKGIPPFIPYSHFCGGTIINNQWILTAGHCVLAVPEFASFIIKAGRHNLNISESTGQTIEVSASYVHESYVGGVAPYDIALLKLKSPLNLNSAVSVISLPKAGSKPTDQSILSGWGLTSASGDNMPAILQKANLPIVDLATCKSALEALAGHSPLHATNFCTGPLTSGPSACSADSGGPVIAKNATGGFEVIGVVSWGISPCGTTGAPSVHVDVASFISWIQNTINKH